jgi:CCR4-NOT transcriptional complex subunit CAF120
VIQGGCAGRGKRDVPELIYTDGKPSHDRSWQECFAQLVGTVLSLWDAAELDAAIPGQEVVPIFLNLTDASIKMVWALYL